MLIVQTFARDSWPSRENFLATPRWAWMGGILSIASTMLGSGVFTGLSVTAALASSILIHHFGWIGFEKHPAYTVRITGCALMVSGLWLVAKSQPGLPRHVVEKLQLQHDAVALELRR